MKVGFLQFSPVRFDIESNLAFIEESLRGTEAKIVVLPEMALTGYLFPSRKELERSAEEIPGPSTHRIEEICRRGGFHVVCGMAERSGGAVMSC